MYVLNPETIHPLGLIHFPIKSDVALKLLLIKCRDKDAKVREFAWSLLAKGSSVL